MLQTHGADLLEGGSKPPLRLHMYPQVEAQPVDRASGTVRPTKRALTQSRRTLFLYTESRLF